MDLCLLILLLLSLSSTLNIPSKGCPPCECESIGNVFIVDCSHRGLQEIPSTVSKNVNHLLLNGNRFQTLQTGSFKRFPSLTYIDLSDNFISNLEENSLDGAMGLQKLNLHNNNLSLSEQSYPKGVFRKQKQLSNLDISRNIKSENAKMSYPDVTFSDLASLQVLMIDGLNNAVFGEGFAKLKRLTNFTLSGDRGYCNIGHLYNISFIHMPFLRFLDVSNCSLKNIDKSAFQPLHNIDTLDLSDNRDLGFDRFGESMFGLRFSKLRVLKASKIVETFAIGVVLQTKHVEYLNDTEVKHIFLDSNRIELVKPMVPFYIVHVEAISVKENRFTYGLYLLTFGAMTHLKKIDASDQYGSSIPHLKNIFRMSNIYSLEKYVRNMFPTTMHDLTHRAYAEAESRMSTDQEREIQKDANCSCVPKTGRFSINDEILDEILDFLQFPNDQFKALPLPLNLTTINVSNSRLAYTIPKLTFSENNVKEIDLSTNLFTKWTGPVTPVDHLEHLDLSNNYCTHMSPYFFQSFFNLRTLNISQNYLASSLINDTEGKLFQNLSQLQVLRINNNLISELPPCLLKDLHSLQFFDLSWNFLSRWTMEIRTLKNLRSLDMSNNRIEQVPNILRDQIDEIVEGNVTFHLRLSGNVLQCTCETLESIKWMMNKYITIDDINKTSCQVENGTTIELKHLDDIILELELYCKTLLPIMAGVTSGLVITVFIIVFGIIYRYRWKLRYLYYTTRRRYRGYQRLTEDEQNYTYDAFVSYADEDRHFVVQDMRHMLEETFNLRLCIHHRDFMVGEAITANIMNAIQASRKTIVVLSPNFLKSSWCDYEVHMAKLEEIHTGRDVICVIWYADVPDRSLISGDLREEIDSGTYLGYTDNEEGRRLFWQSLKDAITY